MIIPGVVAGAAAGGGGGYVAKAIEFAPASQLKLFNPTGFIASNPKGTVHLWVNYTDITGFPAVFDLMDCGVAEIGYNATSDLVMQVLSSTDVPVRTFTWGSADGLFTTNVWHSVFFSWDTNHAAGAKVGNFYFDGINVVDPGVTVDADAAFSVSFAGEDIPREYIDIPTFTEGAGDSLTGRQMADFQMWVGQCIDPSNPSNLAKFISGGKPVDPATAALAFGVQQVLFSGNAASFGTNQGNGGPFVLEGDPLTNASTSPSG